MAIISQLVCLESKSDDKNLFWREGRLCLRHKRFLFISFLLNGGKESHPASNYAAQKQFERHSGVFGGKLSVSMG
jgi:hypothetical protein